MSNVRSRNESAWLLPNDGTHTNHRLLAEMSRYGQDEEVDIVIIGCGAGGGVMTQRLARQGWKVVTFDAGPFWDPDRDWVSDEAGSDHLTWKQTRVISGNNPVPLGANNSGRGVGGSMVAYSGATPRYHPSDFHIRSTDGVGVDWPITYEELRPYYEDIEEELPVAGQYWPWGHPHRYPQSPHPVSGKSGPFIRGCQKRGIEFGVGPVAIVNGRFGHRQHCIYRGFCHEGCKVNAKASPLITHVPDALAHGAEVRPDSMVSKITMGANGRATGVNYFHNGVEYHQRARVVAVAGYSIETPRLLLNSATPGFRDGLCNNFDQVGRYLMVQGAPRVCGRYDEEIRSYKGAVPEVTSEHFYETDPSQDHKRGFTLGPVSPMPITFSSLLSSVGHWGETLREYMRDYVHWSIVGAICEFLPQSDNRVTLEAETDEFGIPVAHFSYSLCDNDRAVVKAGTSVCADIHRAAGATQTMTMARYAHLLGGARMASSEKDGVVDSDQRTFAIPNLYITDGSVIPTQGCVSPGLTIMALAARTADHLASANRG